MSSANLATRAGSTTASETTPNPTTTNDQPTGVVTPPVMVGDFPYTVSDLLNPGRRTYIETNHPARSGKCNLFQESLCRALKNRPILVLAAGQTAALVSDGVTTRQYLHRGYTEVDPVARILIGSKPTWARMAPLGAVQVIASMWLAERMASSGHVWVKRLWWLPQVVGIAANATASAHNVSLH